MKQSQRFLLSFILLIACINPFSFAYAQCDYMSIQSQLMDYAYQEADIAEIPRYKAKIFLDRSDKTGYTNDKIRLAQLYKSSNQKPPLTEEQIKKITEVEKQKHKFYVEKKCDTTTYYPRF